ncbi:MAG: histidine kinase [Chitinophagaceae bacterium]|nr:histidine kinase [Chitinophagaceae bacterium]
MKWWQYLVKFKLHHLLVWGTLFAGWYYFRAKDFPTQELAIQVTAIKVAVLALLTYTTNLLLIPQLLYKKRYFQFFSIYLSIIVGMGLLKLKIIMALVYPGLEPFANFKTRFYDNIIPVFLLVTTGAACRLIKDYLQSQRRLSEIAQEKAQTELKFLKSQINPHFLFNSLNSIYFLIDKQNTEARQTLLQFSDLLRYQLYDCNAETIAIEKEVAYLKDYIRLQELRKDNNYEVAVTIQKDINGFQIVPLLLIPFVENAFKHISHHNNSRNFVHVELARNNGSFSFCVENSKENHLQKNLLPGGIGLNNVKRRLELLYPDKHLLEIHNNDATFKVQLELKI